MNEIFSWPEMEVIGVGNKSLYTNAAEVFRRQSMDACLGRYRKIGRSCNNAVGVVSVPVRAAPSVACSWKENIVFQ